VIVDVVHEERYWYPDDGGIVWVAGYTPVSADGTYLGRASEELRARGLRITSVAGAAAHHAEALASVGAEPGARLTLRRDRENAYDANAIELRVADTGAVLGFVPRELAAELAPLLDAGAVWSAVVLREQRASPRDPRTGVTALLAPAPEIELNVR
jgi:hypothetical protein